MPQPVTWARPTGCPGYSETLPREPESAAAARRLVRAALAAWGMQDLTDDGVLIVSESVSNAVRHARSHAIRVTVARPGPARMRIGVVDKPARLPEARESRDEEESGRGLALVGALAEDWGTDALPWGKRVWAEPRGRDHG